MCKKTYAIELKQVTFNRNEKIIFNKININIIKGKITAIMGPSGCGKTTLLHIMTAKLIPINGIVLVNGYNLSKLSRKKLFEIRKTIGVLFQSGSLFTNINVFDNVAFPLRIHSNIPEDMIHDLVLMKLEAVGLRGAINLMPHELSGGMKRRVALARAISLDPNIIIYDEPFIGQDPISIGVLLKLIRLLNYALDMTSVIISHDVRETASISDYIYIISNSIILGEGTPDIIKTPNNPHITQFINGLTDGVLPFHYPTEYDYHHDLLYIK